MAKTAGLVTGGVDTHADTHVAAVVDQVGRVLGTESFPADADGYAGLLAWMRGHGELDRTGVEGTGSYGAGLARYLAAQGVPVLEVTRPDRQRRRRRGKSDAVDAVSAAISALSGEGCGTPKSADGAAESIRALRVARTGAMKARTQAGNQLRDLVTTAPEPLRAQLAKPEHAPPGPRRHSIYLRRCRRSCRGHQGGDGEHRGPLAGAERRGHPARGHLGRAGDAGRCAGVPRTDWRGPPVRGRPDRRRPATTPGRIRTEAAYAALCGVSTVDCSSGKQERHRLNRGGDRQANAALWRIVVTRLQHDPRTQDYYARRTAAGRTRKEIIRELKRYAAREAYRKLIRPGFLTRTAQPSRQAA